MLDVKQEQAHGVFVGINKFEDPRFKDLEYAVDDAIDLAHYFIVEASLLAPDNVFVLSSGDTAKETTGNKLNELRSLGVSIANATRALVLEAIGDIVRLRPEKKKALVVCFSTHGIRSDADFLVCSDTRRGLLDDTSIGLDRVINDISGVRAEKNLLLIDACRAIEASPKGDDGTPDDADADPVTPEMTRMSERASDLIKSASGLATMFGTTPGGYCFDDPDSRNGLFTDRILRGLRGGAEADENGFITVRTLAEYADREIKEWTNTKKSIALTESSGVTSSSEIAAADLRLAKPKTTRRYIVLSHHRIRNDNLKQRSRWVREEIIARACENEGYKAVDNPHKLLDAQLSQLNHCELAIAYIGKEEIDSDVLAKIGFRLASGLPIIFVTESDTQLPEALSVVLLGRGVDLVSLSQDSDKKAAIKEIGALVKAVTGHFHGSSPQNPTAVVFVKREHYDPNVLYVGADSEAALLLTGNRDPGAVIGRPGESVVRSLVERSLPEQWPYLEREQNELYGNLLSPTAYSGMEVPKARIPFVLKDEHAVDNTRAWMPIVMRKATSSDTMLYYLEVSHLPVDEWVSEYPDGHFELAPPVGPQGLTHLFRARNERYFCPTPIVRVDNDRTISDANIAMHVVAGDLFYQPAGKKISSFLKQFTNRSSRDMRFPKVRLGIQSSHSRIVEGSRLEFSFDSRRLGAVNCIGWMTPSINIIGGDHDGWSWFWELKHIENRARYEKEYKTALDTELLWEVYAASHDRLLKHLPYYNTVRERHEQVMTLAGDEILDVGAGTGNVTLPLLHSGKNVTAIDSSRSMLNHLRAKLAGRFSENLKVFRMSAEDLSRFPENSFDGVTAMMSLYCIKGNGKQRAFDECLRVLKPNGRIVITDIKKDLAKNYEHLRIRARGEFDEVLKMFPEDRTKEMNGHWDRVEECGRSLSKGSNDDPDITELHEMLVERGFSGVELIDSHYGICATIIGVHP